MLGFLAALMPLKMAGLLAGRAVQVEKLLLLMDAAVVILGAAASRRRQRSDDAAVISVRRWTDSSDL